MHFLRSKYLFKAARRMSIGLYILSLCFSDTQTLNLPKAYTKVLIVRRTSKFNSVKHFAHPSPKFYMGSKSSKPVGLDFLSQSPFTRPHAETKHRIWKSNSPLKAQMMPYMQTLNFGLVRLTLLSANSTLGYRPPPLPRSISAQINKPLNSSLTRPRFAWLCSNLSRWCIMGYSRFPELLKLTSGQIKTPDGTLKLSISNSLQLSRGLYDFGQIWHGVWYRVHMMADILQTVKLNRSKVKVTAWRNVRAVKTL